MAVERPSWDLAKRFVQVTTGGAIALPVLKGGSLRRTRGGSSGRDITLASILERPDRRLPFRHFRTRPHRLTLGGEKFTQPRANCSHFPRTEPTGSVSIWAAASRRVPRGKARCGCPATSDQARWNEILPEERAFSQVWDLLPGGPRRLVDGGVSRLVTRMWASVLKDLSG